MRDRLRFLATVCGVKRRLKSDAQAIFSGDGEKLIRGKVYREALTGIHPDAKLVRKTGHSRSDSLTWW